VIKVPGSKAHIPKEELNREYLRLLATPTTRSSNMRISWLLRKGADLNVINEEGETPLVFTLKNKLYDRAKMILRRHPEVFLVDRAGHAAVHYSFMNWNRETNKWEKIHDLVIKEMNRVFPYDSDYFNGENCDK
jgi:ankyrin repeat protein